MKLSALTAVLAAVFVTASVGAGATTAASAATTDGSPSASSALEIVVDGSGSMAAPDPSGGTKIEAAKAALGSVANSLPAGSTVAVRAYGGRYGDSDPRACTDTRVVVPLGPLDATRAKTSVAGLQPLGQTPIAVSLQAAAKDLGTAGSRTIVLISDGQETCGGKPCDVARALAAQGVGLRIDTVGYGADAATAAELQCVASATGGAYLPAGDGPTLAVQLRNLSTRALKAYDPEGTPITGGLGGQTPPALTPGQYLDRIAAGQTRTYGLDLVTGATPYVAATLVRAPGAIPGGTFPVDALTLRLRSPGGTDCNLFERDFNVENDGAVPTTALLRIPVLADDGPGCTDPGRYTLTVARDADTDAAHDAVLPLELRYVSEPPVADESALPPASAGPELGLPRLTGTPTSTSAGGSFNSAPLLAPGLYSDGAEPGETLFYRVHVDWGQRLNVALQAPPMSDAAGQRLIAGVGVKLYNPVRNVLLDDGHGVYFGDPSGTEPLSLQVSTPPVLYRNREAGGDQARSSLAGDWYVAVHVGLVKEASRTIPYRLAVAVTGATTGAPQYVTGDPAAALTNAAPTNAAPTVVTPTVVVPTAVVPTVVVPTVVVPTVVVPTPVTQTAATPTVVAPTAEAPTATNQAVVLSGDMRPDHTGRTVGLAAAGALAILLAIGIALPLLRRR